MKITASTIVACLFLFPLVFSITQYRAELLDHNSYSYKFKLYYTGTDEYFVKPTSPIVKQLIFQVRCLAFQDFYFKITDANKKRYEIEHGGSFPEDPLGSFTFPLLLAAFRFDYNTTPFNFRLSRKINNGTFFSSIDSQLIFSEHYLQIGSSLDSPYIYGIGQRFSKSFRKGPGKWTIFNRDRGQIIDDGKGLQTYGYYPFYLARENNKFFHVNYLRNSNAMDVIVEQKNNNTFVKWKTIGGVLDFRFFMGEQSPQQTLDKFHIYIGLSAIPPFWSLGFHQCRYGYRNSSVLKDVIANYKKHGLPLDTIWTDIDYMIDYEDFTIDETRFPLSDMKAIIASYNYIPIIDAGIKVNNGTAYTEGKRRNVFVKDANNDELRGKVWPGTTTFVDFFNPNATQYWQDMLDILYQKVKFTGVWLDMNEYANFCDGPCQSPSDEGGFDYSKDLPYQPGSDNIESHTIPLNATHYGSKQEADVHAYAALLETEATNKFLRSKGLRPFIITRSSTLGSNNYGFHWTGDNYASWDFLKGSLADNFNNQLWGMQMVGPDICGFGGNTTEELCARWFQVGALYPFARDHNQINAIDQQPYALGSKVLQSAKTNLQLRYSLLKHYYNIFITQKGIGSIFKPLFFVFPLDNNLYLDEIADTQFMIGNILMSAPILQQAKTARNVYFPDDFWYNFHTGQLHKSGTQSIKGVKITDKVPLFLRNGHLVLKQNASNVHQTKELNNNFQMVAAMKKDSSNPNRYHSFGQIMSIRDYNDDAKITACVSAGCQYTFNVELQIESTPKYLYVDVGVIGSFETIYIDEINVYYDGNVITQKMDTPVQIRRAQRKTIPLSDNIGSLQVIQEELSTKELRNQ